MAHLDRIDVMASMWLPDRTERTRVGRLVEAARECDDDAAVALLAQDAGAWAATISVDAGTAVVPVPPSPDRPNRLVPAVAAAIAAAWRVPIVGLIERHAVTPRLRDLEPADRPAAAAAADYRVARRVDVARVVLVDDVVLTGTTLEHVAAVLRGHGVPSVSAVVVARSRRG